MRLPSLSPSEIAAVSAALPLVAYLPAATPEQEDLNQMLLKSVQFKLAAHAHSFSDNELRIFFLSVCSAVLYFQNSAEPIFSRVPPEFMASLAPHFFTLNRLYPSFDQLLTRLESRYGVVDDFCY